MNLQIKLKDPKYCDGCPCLNYEFDDCNIQEMPDLETTVIKGNHFRRIRPQKCRLENGD